ncbi:MULTISPECIES: PTS sugar transporter subunit IIB [Actinomyces]|jgi:PTS system ascorbate-specific IIB component|uniref:Phosphotransferase system eiib component type 2/3 n=1 Tax=Actinomyces glycerinitolerans TaxID=1892869 RepID=A0A1M4RYL8_9ACTO|nr:MULTISPECIES: PTS sugar transporter subunit IIB [Actinomyces]RAX22002.1 PTS sugar transporter subunit IIB [Actinomyces sp. Z3]RAX24094.1 PTS sugar transporter subunit IIB [Actinomyces sp. Z5]SHE25073.1 phosphotransferase system eiib component type 2/3 [Actinomyces glycerinitolerans]
MTRPLDIYFICGAGLGSSLACQMEAEEVLADAGIRANLGHEAISGIPGVRADIIVSAENFKPTIEKYELDPAISFVFLKNIVDKTEIAEKLLPVVQEKEARA